MGIENADKSEDFITALVKLQKACDVADLKTSDFEYIYVTKKACIVA